MGLVFRIFPLISNIYVICFYPLCMSIHIHLNTSRQCREHEKRCKKLQNKQNKYFHHVAILCFIQFFLLISNIKVACLYTSGMSVHLHLNKSLQCRMHEKLCKENEKLKNDFSRCGWV